MPLYDPATRGAGPADAVAPRRGALAGPEPTSKRDEARAAFQQDLAAEDYLALRNGNCLTFQRVDR
jgi:hypothetical protein